MLAVQCGTAFVRCPESGAHPVYKAALADRRFTQTALTRALSGWPARGLANAFMAGHRMRGRLPEQQRDLAAARDAAKAGDADRMSLWAGTGFRAATTRPAAEVVDLLTPAGGAHR